MEQLREIYERSIHLRKRFSTLAVIFFLSANASLIGAIILYMVKVDVLLVPELIDGLYLSNVLLELFTIFVSVAIMFILFSSLVFARRAKMAKLMMENKSTVIVDNNVTVDVKDIPQSEPQNKSKYSKIIDEYQKLYDQGLISKEDFETKKKELEQF